MSENMGEWFCFTYMLSTSFNILRIVDATTTYNTIYAIRSYIVFINKIIESSL